MVMKGLKNIYLLHSAFAKVMKSQMKAPIKSFMLYTAFICCFGNLSNYISITICGLSIGVKYPCAVFHEHYYNVTVSLSD